MANAVAQAVATSGGERSSHAPVFIYRGTPVHGQASGFLTSIRTMPDCGSPSTGCIALDKATPRLTAAALKAPAALER